MIPKTIHYCWFGRGEKPELARKCIASWQKFLPDYEIKEWNEDNFDLDIIPYTRQAYDAKKYAYVSDYVRIWALYNYGGVYFDTDVELIKPIDDILSKGPFMGIEHYGNDSDTQINPGEGLAAEPQMRALSLILEEYAHRDCSYEGAAIVIITTAVMCDLGFTKADTLQEVGGFTIYPNDFFNPYNYLIDRLKVTGNTRSIHWYAKSWVSGRDMFRFHIGQVIRKIKARFAK